MKRYEVHLPVSEILVFEVIARNKREALQKVLDNDESITQTCTLGGTGKRKVIIKAREVSTWHDKEKLKVKNRIRLGKEKYGNK